MDQILHNITSNDNSFMFVMIFGVGGLVAIISVFLGTVRKITVTKERERSRREIAAYIAEGSMTPEDGERLLKAGRTRLEDLECA